MRLRDLGIEIGTLATGPNNAITDVSGVRVGMTTLVEGAAGPLVVGQGPVRTGVTVVLPSDRPWEAPVFAGFHRLNGNGEVTGTHWIRESGLLTSAIAITNTHAVGVVRDALVTWEASVRNPGESFFALPVVAETYDGTLNDINGGHVKAEHVLAAVEAATSGAVAEGNVGGGTGMTAHGFKGGTGTSSRVVGDWTVGVLVQANYGQRRRFRVDGVPVGEYLDVDRVPLPANVDQGAGSIIVVVATDAPLLAHQCDRLAARVTLAIGRLGGLGEHQSGDLFLAFSTGNRGRIPSEQPGTRDVTTAAFDLTVLPNHAMSPLFEGVVDATEEAVLNALLGAQTMSGIDGVTSHALTPDLLLEAIEAARHNAARVRAHEKDPS